MEHRRPLKQSDICCLNHLERVVALLERLHDSGTLRDKAGNRELFFDDYCKLVLLYLWNPLLNSLRMLQEAAELENVSKKLGVKRFSLGSFSESVRVFDPERLKPIIAELAGQLPVVHGDKGLRQIRSTLTVVDSTVLRGMTRLVKFACGEAGRGPTLKNGQPFYGWRLHTQLDLETFSPKRIERTPVCNAGEHRENNVLRGNLESGRCYVGDGGYDDRSLFDDIVAADSSYVTSMRANAVFGVIEERTLSSEALDSGVVRDALVDLKRSDGQSSNHQIRLVVVQVPPREVRTRAGFATKDHLLLVTNMLELPAELIGLIYLQRYTIELFFRTFKSLLGLRHLLGQHEEAVDIQVYCTVIVSLLLCLITGKKPSKSNRNMINWYLMGLAKPEELIAHLNKPDNTGIKLRAKEELWKKLGV